MPQYMLLFARKLKQVDLKHEIDIYWVNNSVTEPFSYFLHLIGPFLSSTCVVTRSVDRVNVGSFTVHLDIGIECATAKAGHNLI